MPILFEICSSLLKIIKNNTEVFEREKIRLETHIHSVLISKISIGTIIQGFNPHFLQRFTNLLNDYILQINTSNPVTEFDQIDRRSNQKVILQKFTTIFEFHLKKEFLISHRATADSAKNEIITKIESTADLVTIEKIVKFLFARLNHDPNISFTFDEATFIACYSELTIWHVRYFGAITNLNVSRTNINSFYKNCDNYLNNLNTLLADSSLSPDLKKELLLQHQNLVKLNANASSANYCRLFLRSRVAYKIGQLVAIFSN